MTRKEYKRKSAMLVRIMALQYWDDYARNLISDLLKHISNPKIKKTMEEKLKEIIEAHETNLVRYTQERDDRISKMKFLSEHKFMQELAYLQTQRDAINDMFYDYRNAIEELRKMLNAWNS